MSLVGQLETEIESKVAAAEFHNIFSRRSHHVSKMSPEYIQGSDLHEGEWGKPGTVFSRYYMHDGVPQVCKEIIEEIDDEKNLTTFKVIEGHLMEKYKNFYVIVQATPKDEGSLVHWTLKFEKLSEDVSEPKGILHILTNVTKDIDAHLIKEQA